MDGDDLGRWLQRQQQPSTWAQLSDEQQERLTRLGKAVIHTWVRPSVDGRCTTTPRLDSPADPRSIRGPGGCRAGSKPGGEVGSRRRSPRGAAPGDQWKVIIVLNGGPPGPRALNGRVAAAACGRRNRHYPQVEAPEKTAEAWPPSSPGSCRSMRRIRVARSDDVLDSVEAPLSMAWMTTPVRSRRADRPSSPSRTTRSYVPSR